MSKRIGILGGSFDPIHNGHLILASDALEQFQLDQVLFLPAYQAPLKDKAPSASAAQRMEMVELAIEGEPRFKSSDIDFRSEGTSYSYLAAESLAQEFPDATLFWILGADQISQLHRWRRIDLLAGRVTFIAFQRPGFELQANPDLPSHTQIELAPARQLDISSTEIRERLNSGRVAKYFLPDKVFAYIKAETLYQTP